VLVELGVVEQRHKAVLEVLDGFNITDVALLHGVSRKTVHKWLRRYAAHGLKGLADKSSKPDTCPHQMAPAVEVRIVKLPRAHPGRGPRRIRTPPRAGPRRGGAGPFVDPSGSGGHGLIDPTTRKRRRPDYKRWERSRAMELWKMDVVGRSHLADGTEVKVITGIDDHSRFCVCARIVARDRASGRDGAAVRARHLRGARWHPHRQWQGLHRSLRFWSRPGAVRPGVRVERDRPPAHRAVRADDDREGGALPQNHCATSSSPTIDRRATISEAQPALDAWVREYNTTGPTSPSATVRRSSAFVWPASRWSSPPRPTTNSRRR